MNEHTPVSHELVFHVVKLYPRICERLACQQPNISSHLYLSCGGERTHARHDALCTELVPNLAGGLHKRRPDVHTNPGHVLSASGNSQAADSVGERHDEPCGLLEEEALRRRREVRTAVHGLEVPVSREQTGSGRLVKAHTPTRFTGIASVKTSLLFRSRNAPLYGSTLSETSSIPGFAFVMRSYTAFHMDPAHLTGARMHTFGKHRASWPTSA
jgi:hypothetical protein